ncbi:MAG: uracil phosphoribosyltransferase [Microscillaceae bacterium]
MNQETTPRVFVLNHQPSVANHFLAEIRDKNIQKDPFRFRTNLSRLGQILAYELSRYLHYETRTLHTPLGTIDTPLLSHPPVLATILRAGLPLYEGFLSVFDRAESAFVGAYRSPLQEDNSFDIVQGYTVTPDLNNKVLVLIDPMLATGKSVHSVYESLLFYGQPAVLHLVSVIASAPGVAYVQKHLPQAHIWTGAIDPELDQHSYIVPGLGDAGDLAFGNKE